MSPTASTVLHRLVQVQNGLEGDVTLGHIGRGFEPEKLSQSFRIPAATGGKQGSL